METKSSVLELHRATSWIETFPPLPICKDPPSDPPDPSIALEVLPPPTLSLGLALSRRKTCRAFSQEPIRFAELSRLLAYGCGVRGEESDPVLRTYPSAGALYQVRLHLMVQNIKGLQSGSYLYQPRSHSLLQTHRDKLSEETLVAAFGTGEQLRVAKDAACIIVMTAAFEAVTHKYGMRGYRFALQESGHIAQNLGLLCPALYLGAISLGAFLDDGLEKALGLDSSKEGVLYAFAVGKESLGSEEPKLEPTQDLTEDFILDAWLGKTPNSIDVTTAVEAYRSAGRLAIEQLSHEWLYWRLYTYEWNLMANPELYAVLEDLRREDSIRGFWHLHKSDGGHHIRLRIEVSHPSKRFHVKQIMEEAFGKLLIKGLLKSFDQGSYDPETYLYGGPRGISIAHRVWMLENRFFPRLLQMDHNRAYQASLIWMELMLRKLGLDAFEKWDVWKKVNRFRPSQLTSPESLSGLIRALQSLADSCEENLAKSLIELAGIDPSLLDELTLLMTEMKKISLLDAIKPREWFSIFVLFHWNRMHLDGNEQALLCYAWTQALHPHTISSE